MPSQFSADDIEMYRRSVAGELSGRDAMLYPNVDWYDQVLSNTAPAQRYNVSVTGGTKRMRYYASGEFYDQKSIVKNLSNDQFGNTSSPGFRRYSFRANTDFFDYGFDILGEFRYTFRGTPGTEYKRLCP